MEPGKKTVQTLPGKDKQALFAPIPENNAESLLAAAERSVDADDAELERMGLKGPTLYMSLHPDGRMVEYQARTKRTSGTNPNTDPTASNNNTSSTLFGGNTTTTQQPAQGSLFGSTNTTQQPATTSNMFGQNSAQQSATSSNLFGQNTTQQPAASSGLFGQSVTQQQPATSTLFGQSTAQPTTASSSSLFGQNLAQPTSSNLFGQSAAQPTASSGLFGQNTSQQPATSSLFGQSAAKRPAPTMTGLFSQPANPAANTSSLFNTARPQATQTQSQAPSLLAATMRAQEANATPFGRLGMSQNNASQSISGVKIDMDNIRSTTRFEDCIDPIRAQLESIDKMIQQQESFAKQIEAILPRHAADVASLMPDVELITEKVESVEQALEVDAAGVAIQRNIVTKDATDVQRCERVVQNLLLPRQFHYNSALLMSMYAPQQMQGNAPKEGTGEPLGGDADLVNNYFAPLALDMSKIIKGYNDNLTEIEAHMRVIEDSAVDRARKLAQRRAGVGGRQTSAGGDDTVRELANTLRGFEQSILGVAGVVGECREGLNELFVGKYTNGRY